MSAIEHLRFELGNLKKGAIAVVTLRNQANVQLMTRGEYANYQAGRQYRYHGGRVTRSPFRIPVPSDGAWVIAIDLGGLSGQVSASVDVLPPPRGFLPEARTSSENPASAVAVRDDPREPAEHALGGQTWDVFISHASEDKETVARPLRAALAARGITCWLDEAEIKMGQSLRRRIDDGIRSSRFGVVVLSRPFLEKGWTNHELDGLVTQSLVGEQSVLPIWHGLRVDEVRQYSPSLADKLAANTSNSSIEEIAEQIAEVVKAK